METTTPKPPTLGGFFHSRQRYFLADQTVGDSRARCLHCATGTECRCLIGLEVLAFGNDCQRFRRRRSRRYWVGSTSFLRTLRAISERVKKTRSECRLQNSKCSFGRIIKYVPAKSCKCENTQQNRWLINDRCGRLASFWLMRENKPRQHTSLFMRLFSIHTIVLRVMRLVTLA